MPSSRMRPSIGKSSFSVCAPMNGAALAASMRTRTARFMNLSRRGGGLHSRLSAGPARPAFGEKGLDALVEVLARVAHLDQVGGVDGSEPALRENASNHFLG